MKGLQEIEALFYFFICKLFANNSSPGELIIASKSELQHLKCNPHAGLKNLIVQNGSLIGIGYYIQFQSRISTLYLWLLGRISIYHIRRIGNSQLWKATHQE